MAYITVWHWMNKDYPAYFAHDAYWGMVGGDSNTAKIVRCDKYKSTRYEQHSIDEYETIMFSTRHPVYITNSNGTSCNITIYPPVPLEKPKNLLPLPEQVVNKGNVTLSWDMVAEAGTKYYITINNNANPWCDPPIEECSNPEYPNCTKYEGDYCGEVTTNSITLDLLPGFYSWWVQTIDQWGNLSEATFTNLTVVDPCEGITCPDYCDYENHVKYLNGECIDGECVYDIIENSEECGFDPCEGIICEDVCIGTNLYSQKCIDGLCITDQLLERNSLSCGYMPPEEPEEPEEPSDLTKLIIPIGIGIGLLLLSKK